MGLYQNAGKAADDAIAQLTLQVTNANKSIDTLSQMVNEKTAEIAALKAQLPVPVPVPVPTPTPIPNTAPHAVGIYCSGGINGVSAFETWLGKKVDLVHQYMPPTTGVSTLAAWSPYSSRMLISLDMMAGSSMPLSKIAVGVADSVYKTFGERLVSAGMANAIIRIGWEYTGSWMAWALGKTTLAIWNAAFDRIVTVLKAVPGNHFKFELNFAQGKDFPPSVPKLFDYLGADTYAGYGGDSTGKGVTYNDKASRDKWFNGDPKATNVDRQRGFIQIAHDLEKPIAISEWGMWWRDDAVYMQEMVDRFAKMNLAYQVAFNVQGHDGIEHRFPSPYSAGGAVFKKAYGK